MLLKNSQKRVVPKYTGSVLKGIPKRETEEPIKFQQEKYKKCNFVFQSH